MSRETKLGVFYGWGVVEPVNNCDQSDEAVDALMTRYGPTGHRVVGSFGPLSEDGSCEPVLDIAITSENPFAYLKWGDEVGIESGFDSRPEQPQTFDDGIEAETQLPAAHMAVSRGRARRAVREYIETGRQPTCVEWK